MEGITGPSSAVRYLTPRRGGPKSPAAAVGLRVKSGWATAVLMVGPARAPHVADRRVVALSDPAVPASRQPYHAVMGASAATRATVERRLRTVVQNVTRQSVRDLLQAYRAGGHAVRAVALVVGSDIDPARIANDHIRAHALEGRLFRTVLEAAISARRLACAVVLERDAYQLAAGVLGRPAAKLKRAVKELGRLVGGPWRADEKVAALAAWMVLGHRFTTLRRYVVRRELSRRRITWRRTT